MKDPYEVLGVGRNASADEVRTAYMELVKKYHPDKYQNNPLSDLAQEKLKEVNEAYDAITNGKASNSGGGKQYYQHAQQGRTNGNQEFANVRQYIDNGNLQAAETVLKNSSVRNAEWFFLSGMVAYRKGWHDDAVQMMQQATMMEPNNFEYKRALNSIMQQGGMFQNTAYGRGYNNNEDMLCKMCQCYLCTDMLCDCI